MTKSSLDDQDFFLFAVVHILFLICGLCAGCTQFAAEPQTARIPFIILSIKSQPGNYVVSRHLGPNSQKLMINLSITWV